MEKKKLLRWLVIVFFVLIIAKSFADEEEFAKELGINAKNMLWEELKSKTSALDDSKDVISTQKERGGKLYVFISSGMPKTLLKEYYQQSEKYKAVLVFKGLPEGSFRKLYQLIAEISSNHEQDEVAMQIDDESFAKYKIEQVPAFVLVKDEEYHPSKEEKLVYDKITGNIGIKYALEQFAEKGDLKQIAKEYLQ